MDIKIIKTCLEEIQDFRALFLEENDFQFIYDKCHLYGWAETYEVLFDGTKLGYGSLWGEKKDAIFEFYITPAIRKFATPVFQKFIDVSKAVSVECQSNDFLLTTMLFENGRNINAEAILFKDNVQTDLVVPGAIFTKKAVENKHAADVGGYELEMNGVTAATGGFMLNYNFPYADIYMEVKENFRGRGLGSLIVQELKKEIYRIKRVPAARCNIKNQISKRTLLKAGFKECGFILKGEIASPLTTSPAP